MPQGKQNPSPKPRSAEEVLSDECVATALALLHLRRALRAGDPSAVRKVARETARILHLALATEMAIRMRDECLLVFLKCGGDQ